MRDVVIVGADMVPFGKHRDLSLAGLAGPAVIGALRAAGAERADIDAVYSGNVTGGMLVGQRIVSRRQLSEKVLLAAFTEESFEVIAGLMALHGHGKFLSALFALRTSTHTRLRGPTQHSAVQARPPSEHHAPGISCRSSFPRRNARRAKSSRCAGRRPALTRADALPILRVDCETAATSTSSSIG